MISATRFSFADLLFLIWLYKIPNKNGHDIRRICVDGPLAGVRSAVVGFARKIVRLYRIYLSEINWLNGNPLMRVHNFVSLDWGTGEGTTMESEIHFLCIWIKRKIHIVKPYILYSASAIFKIKIQIYCATQVGFDCDLKGQLIYGKCLHRTHNTHMSSAF